MSGGKIKRPSKLRACGTPDWDTSRGTFFLEHKPGHWAFYVDHIKLVASEFPLPSTSIPYKRVLRSRRIRVARFLEGKYPP